MLSEAFSSGSQVRTVADLGVRPPARGRVARKVVAVAGNRAVAVLCGSCLLLAGLMSGASVANTSHAGWYRNMNLVMDKHAGGGHYVLRGIPGIHNELLGGWSSDTIYGGNAGDVIWADYRETGAYNHVGYIYAGNGKNFIYATDTVNYVWTGTNPKTVVHAHNTGYIHCQSPGIIVYTFRSVLPHYHLYDCRHISFYSVGY